MDVSCLARLCMTECSLEISWNCPLWRLLKKKILLASTERFKRKDVTYLYSSTICIFINMFFFVHPFLRQIEVTSYFTLKLLGFKICLYVCMDSFVFSISNTLQLRNHLLHTVLGSSDYLAGVVSHSQTELPQTCHIQTSLPTQRKNRFGDVLG